ncbi:MAG: RnfABCDGE type electron transport complex subunit D [Gammaproteobacteria bacterium]|nr:RnfABCDGE type electron transport complex subunit D [Gammaproteobacteria bacterium]
MNIKPFIHSQQTTTNIIYLTLIALTPALVASILKYEWKGTLLVLITIISAGIIELLIAGRKGFDKSIFITALIFALILPANIPLWIPPLGCAIAILMGKHMFGGLGHNLFNPAVLSRAILMVAIPSLFFTTGWGIDGITQATPLAKEMGALLPNLDIPFNSGLYTTLAQISPFAVIAGGLFLIFFRVIDWRVPFYYLATVCLLAWILPPGDRIIGHTEWLAYNPFIQLFGGGTLFAAFFLLTDPITSPFSAPGRIIYAVIAGAYTIIIRYYTPYPDGVTFAILLVNMLTPVINKHVFDYVYKKKIN